MTILVDDREVVEHPDIPNLLAIPFTIVRLDAADYVFLDSEGYYVGIERCHISNYIQKLRSGELEDQLYKCQSFYRSIILLKEGVYDELGGLLATYKHGNKGYFRDYVYPHTTYESIKASEVRLSGMGIEFVDTDNFVCSMIAVKVIYDQRTKPEEKHTMFKAVRKIQLPVKLSADPAVPRLMALVPRMPEKVAIALIYKYNNIWSILQASDRELMEIKGMGKNLVERLRDNVGQP
jgi:ERCC4-type nuclease